MFSLFADAYTSATHIRPTGHRVDKYNSKWSCKTCVSRHHTLLHVDKVTANDTNVTIPDDNYSCQTMPSNVTVCTTSVGGRVLMANILD